MRRFIKILVWTNAVFMFGLNILINCNVVNASILNNSLNASFADDCSYNPPTCAAGGCMAKECAFSGSIAGVSVSNKVVCEGSYACCHITAYCFSKSACGSNSGNDNC